MANHVSHRMVLTGPATEIARFKAAVTATAARYEAVFGEKGGID